MTTRHHAGVRSLLAATLVLVSLGASQTAQALDAQTLFNDSCKYGLLDADVCAAEALVACVGQSSNVDAVLKCAGTTNPNAKKFVNMYFAAQKPDYITFIQLAGPIIACQLSVLQGPPKNILCSTVIKPYVEKSLDTAVAIYKAAESQDYLKVVYILVSAGADIKTACNLVPDAGPVCSVLALLPDAKQFADALAKGGAAAWYGLGDALGLNDPAAMPTAKYYQLYWQPWYHYGTLLCLDKACQGMGPLTKSLWDPCVDYFASHDMTHSTAVSACDVMRDNKFNKEVKAYAAAMPTAVDGYFEAVARPAIKVAVLESYGKQSGPDLPGQKFFHQNCVFQMKKAFPFPDPDPNRCEAIKQSPFYQNSTFKQALDAQYTKCLADTAKQLPSPSAWDVACQGMDQKYAAAYTGEGLALLGKLNQLKSIGCYPATGWDVKTQGLMVECASYAAVAECHASIELGNKKHCRAGAQADQKLAQEIVAKLGTKRCGVVAGNNVSCARPWKEEACKAFLADTGKAIGGQPAIKCTHNATALVAFSALAAQAKANVSKVNKLMPTQQMSVSPKIGGGSPTATVKDIRVCDTTWDPLAVHCQFDTALQTFKKVAGGNVASCLPDANKDGSDQICYLAPLTASSKAPLSGKASVPVAAAQAQDKKKPGGFVPATASRAIPPAATGTQGAQVPQVQAAAKIAGTPALASSKPQLAVVGAQVKVEANCQAPLPALTAQVSIKNSGGALGPVKGTVHIKENGGANLSSAGIALPAIAAGQTQTVSIPVTMPAAYSTLPGLHQLSVHLDPQVTGASPSFEKPPAPYQLSVNVPAGHCAQRMTSPARR
jgi:hypothetical protein